MASDGVAAQAVSVPQDGETAESVTVTPGDRYDAGWLTRFFNGDNRRDLWLRPLDVPVLRLDDFGGGLEPEEQGGNQSRTLHMIAPHGRTYIFRSTDKFVGQLLPEDLRGTWIQDLMQDHVSMYHPTAGLVVPRLDQQLGLLAVPGALRVMPDDPRLGEFRETFAGMLGLVVERPDEAEGDRPLYGGYEKIVGTEELLEKLEEDPVNQVDAREYLAHRLVDFMVGDTDRNLDQWRWAREDEPNRARWRPIARDRDWAFVHADGVLARLARLIYPKLVTFDATLPDIEALTWADRDLGRRLLTELSWPEWERVLDGVQAGLGDEIINQAVALLPPAHRATHAADFASKLRARRDALRPLAREYYERLSTDVDVRGTDLHDHAEILRRPDGTLRVRLHGEGVGWYYDRAFAPAETEEVRVFLHGGDDVAVVRGTGAHDIRVRVIGGGDSDELYDLSTGGPTVLYDSRGDNLLVPGPRTRVDERPYEEPTTSATFLERDLGFGRHRDWGGEVSWFNPALGYLEGAGVVIGGGPTWTDYGFRREPYARKLSIKGLYGTRSGGFALDVAAEQRAENSPLGLRLHGRASQIDAVRFYGYGNDTPRLSPDLALIMQDRVVLEGAVVLEGDEWQGAVGPVFRWTRPRVPDAHPRADGDPGPEQRLETGLQRMTEMGATAEAVFRQVDRQNVPTQGVQVSGRLSAFPGVDPTLAPHAGADLEARAYLPVPVWTEPVVALRAGARTAWGAFPVHDAAWIGGSTTLRGYRWQRLAGDAALYGGVELRLPLTRVNLGLVRGRLGVLGLADAGRVYVDGSSPGGWHTGYGGGLFLETMETAVHAVWARGEEDRVYVGLGLPF